MKKTILALLLALAAVPALAFTECNSTVNPPFFGTINSVAGSIQVPLASGVTFQLLATDPNFKNFLTVIELAKMQGTPIQVRFTASGVSCTSGVRTDVEGIWQI